MEAQSNLKQIHKNLSFTRKLNEHLLTDLNNWIKTGKCKKQWLWSEKDTPSSVLLSLTSSLLKLVPMELKLNDMMLELDFNKAENEVVDYQVSQDDVDIITRYMQREQEKEQLKLEYEKQVGLSND